MNQSSEFLGKRQRLTTRTATGIDDDTKLLSGKKAQDMQGMGVTAWPELFHTAAEQADRIVGVHVLLDHLPANDWVKLAGAACVDFTPRKTEVAGPASFSP